ncbi:insulin-like peptide INSL5 [Aegotheles albertisi]
MRGSVLALALLAVLVTPREGRGEGNTVRLCGRDFVRAVVFTCGGSRWRRHLPDYHYLFESANPPPFPHENQGYPDPWTSTEQGLETDSEEPHGTQREMEPDPQHPRKTSMPQRREAAKLLTTSCCSIGCSEREISSLC